MAVTGGGDRPGGGPRDMTPEECIAMERATLMLQMEIRDLLASRPFAVRRAAANGAPCPASRQVERPGA